MVRETHEAGCKAHAYLEVRYEALVREPAAVLETVCRFLKLKFDPAMLRYWDRAATRLGEHRTRYGMNGRALISHDDRVQQQRLTMQPPQLERASCWRQEMNPEYQSEFARHAGAMLRELGYGHPNDEPFSSAIEAQTRLMIDMSAVRR